MWNSLPDIVVRAESVNSFKGRLDRFIYIMLAVCYFL